MASVCPSAMPDGEGATVTLCSEGSALAPSPVFSVGNGLAKVWVGSSAHDRLAVSQVSSSGTHQISFPSQFTPEESRASLTILLGKLVLSGVLEVLCELFCGSLNSTGSLDFGPLSVTEEDVGILDKSNANSYGDSTLLDYQSTLLSTVLDAVGAL